MAVPEFYSLSEAARRLGASRKLVAFLVREHQIPLRQHGAWKLLDRDGFERLREAHDAYLAKPEPIAV